VKRVLELVREFIRKGDILLLGLCLIANLFGIALIYSATRYSPSLSGYAYKQALAMALGVLVYMFLTFVDIEVVIDRLWKGLVGFNILFLLLLVPFGNDGGTGNKSWINIPLVPFNIQPAEVVKLSFVLLLAMQFYLQQDRGVSRPSSIAQTAGHTLFMCGLIAAVSGDLGMVLVYLFIFIIMAYTAGVRLRWFALGAAACGGLGYLAWPHLPEYIQMRFLVVLDHSLDPQGKGFQQSRSILALGSGQLTGQGYLNGTQTQSAAASALPARHTDFIFAVAGEELGLIGCIAILLILSAIILRCVWVSRTARNPVCAYIAIGYAGMLMLQTMLNVGMCLYVFPVVGLTLPFFSSGGSSILTLYAAMGIVSSIKMRSLPSWLRDHSNI
jgi:rod shape determining protein RodA